MPLEGLTIIGKAFLSDTYTDMFKTICLSQNYLSLNNYLPLTLPLEG